jgi:hypothetical protein
VMFPLYRARVTTRQLHLSYRSSYNYTMRTDEWMLLCMEALTTAVLSCLLRGECLLLS